MNIIELVRRNGIKLRKASSAKGGEYVGPCPGCGGRDRFHVWPAQEDGQGSYWCRGCGKAGDCVQYLRDFEGLTFHQACERLGRPLPDSKDLAAPRAPAHVHEWEPRVCETPVDLWQEKARKFCEWCYEQLCDNQGVIDWLIEERGIEEKSIARYGLGWNPGKEGKDIYRDRASWGLEPEKRPDGRDKPLWLPVGLVIPWFDEAGAVRRLRIRRPEPRAFSPELKYYVVPGSAMDTMVVEPQRKAHVIVEAELDAILVAQDAIGLAGAVGLGSVSTRPDERAARILSASCQVLVALDSDGPGGAGAKWWKEHFPDCERWPVPKGKDPGEAKSLGVDIKEWVRAGLPPGLR